MLNVQTTPKKHPRHFHTFRTASQGWLPERFELKDRCISEIAQVIDTLHFHNKRNILYLTLEACFSG